MKFKTKRKKSLPEISTSSLPDIIFILLFFFMVTMVIKDDQSKFQVDRPTAVQIEKMKHLDLSATIWVGYDEGQSIPLIQFDKRLIQVDEVAGLIAEKRATLPESSAPLFTTIIKADRELPMYLITDIKQELRSINALKIQYSIQEES
ncbi:biopolymer transporter ExbD [Salibacteraceae bacterium]|nr:biopolymer transporter ExbD [Flavobacteriales bacterium]MDB9701544.1 biopolymer transporter ExbD [Salibacteraceae bacterium]